jgi:tetratricopeptide (TPR) repeat protein
LLKKHSVTFIIIALTIFILTVYWQVQGHQFIDFDDQLYVTDNYGTQTGLTFKGIINTFTDVHTGHWHPLTMLSHMLDWQLFGDNAGGHHWTSVIIHIINTILLFLLFRNLTGAIWRSAFIAALFAIHPINVESVAWVAERKNVLSTFFWIATILLYVWYVKNPSWKRYLPVFVCFALGLMSKPMLVTLPFVLLLLDYWPLNRTMINIHKENEPELINQILVKRAKISSLILEKVPLFILMAVSICLTYYAAQSVKTVSNLDILPMTMRLSNAIVAYGLYIKKLFWPIDLAVFYPLTYIPIWQVSIAAVLLMVVTFIACRYFRDYPYLPVGWFWYLGTLVPVIGIVQVGSQSMADRYAYVPFIGLFLIISWGIPQILSKINNSRIYSIIIFCFIVLTFTAATYRQVNLWKNTETLFEDALKNNPENYFAYSALAANSMNKREYDQALYYYYMVLKIKPKYDEAYINAGIILIKTGKTLDAISCFKKAIQLNDRSVSAHYNLGTALMHNNYLDGAVFHLNKALEVKPDYIDALNNLGLTLLKKGKYNEAIMNFNKILELKPADERAQKNIKLALSLEKKNMK